MTHKIHKFLFEGKPNRYINLPVGAEIVHVHAQDRDVAVWYSFDAQQNLTESRDFYIVGTGHDFANDMVYHGTAHIDPYVWHVMEQKK